MVLKFRDRTTTDMRVTENVSYFEAVNVGRQTIKVQAM
jgi:hypothetical protein